MRIGARLATAGLASALTIGGLSTALDSIVSREPRITDWIPPLAGSILGAVAGKLLLKDGPWLYGRLVASTTFVGLCVGMYTRPGPVWYPPAADSAWALSWTFVGALLGACFTRSTPSDRARLLKALGVIVFLFVLFVILVPLLLRN